MIKRRQANKTFLRKERKREEERTATVAQEYREMNKYTAWVRFGLISLSY